MELESLYRWGVGAIFGAAALTLPVLFFVTAPYGRHGSDGWGPTLPGRAGWIWMELPAPLVFAVVYATGEHAGEGVPLLLCGLWQLHYLQRTFVFPLLMRGNPKPTALVTFVLALLFNTANGALNAFAVSHLASYAPGWTSDPRFLAGVALFLAGYAINLHSDLVLRNLRAPGETGYKIPRGGFYRWVSSANYFGEILEWCGWALAAWSAAGAVFAVFTVANLLPRALDHHRWYRERFPDYPPKRKAILPGIL